MRKIVLTYGILSGLIITVLNYTLMPLFMTPESYSTGEIIGYVSMLLALSMIFFGIYRFRKDIGNGKISFKKAFMIGLSITLIASVIYVIGWMIYSYFINPEFMDQYFDYSADLIKQSGMPQEEIDAKLKQLESHEKMYGNPLIKIGVTFLEIFPIGLVAAVIAALVFKRK